MRLAENSMNLPFVLNLITRHEGFRPTCYKDTRGFLTIGIGFNLDAAGADQVCIDHGLNYFSLRDGQPISLMQAQAVLGAQVTACEIDAQMILPHWPMLPDNVQAVVVDMLYNMGLAKFEQFQLMLTALRCADYPEAARQMRNSLWYKQVGLRAIEDVQLMEAA
jgi:lysozyme